MEVKQDAGEQQHPRTDLDYQISQARPVGAFVAVSPN